MSLYVIVVDICRKTGFAKYKTEKFAAKITKLFKTPRSFFCSRKLNPRSFAFFFQIKSMPRPDEKRERK